MIIQYLNGLGVVARTKRKLSPGYRYNRFFPKPDRSDPILSYNGDTYDTIKHMRKIVADTLADTKKIAPLLKGADLRATCKKIFDFLYRHVQYHPDHPSKEQLRSPSRTWEDRKKGVDCDCYSIFISSVLTNLGIPHFFRKTGYNAKRGFQHIYVIVPKRRGANLDRPADYWTIDPVLDAFDSEKRPILQKHDEPVLAPKSLNGLNGLNGLARVPGAETVYYSPEAEKHGDDVHFFDGVWTYEKHPLRLQGLSGRGLNGWLKRIWKGVKKIGGKILKPLVKIASPVVNAVVPGAGLVLNSLFSGSGKSGSKGGKTGLKSGNFNYNPNATNQTGLKSGTMRFPANPTSKVGLNVQSTLNAEAKKKYFSPTGASGFPGANPWRFPTPWANPYLRYPMPPPQPQSVAATQQNSELLNLLVGKLLNSNDAHSKGYDLNTVMQLITKNSGMKKDEVYELLKQSGMSEERVNQVAQGVAKAEAEALKRKENEALIKIQAKYDALLKDLFNEQQKTKKEAELTKKYAIQQAGKGLGAEWAIAGAVALAGIFLLNGK